MAIAFVNAATGATPGSSTPTSSGPQNHTAGNFLVGWLIWEDTNTTISTVTDTALNSYTILTATALNGVKGQMFYAENITGNASNVVTATLGANAAFKRVTVVQYSGIATSSSFDQQNASSGSGTATNSGNITTTQADELIVYGVGAYGSVSGTPGSNWTERDDTGTSKFAERIVAATGTYAVSGTGADSYVIGSQDWVSKIASFKAAVGGGGGTVGPLIGRRLVHGGILQGRLVH